MYEKNSEISANAKNKGLVSRENMDIEKFDEIFSQSIDAINRYRQVEAKHIKVKRHAKKLGNRIIGYKSVERLWKLPKYSAEYSQKLFQNNRLLGIISFLTLPLAVLLSVVATPVVIPVKALRSIDEKRFNRAAIELKTLSRKEERLKKLSEELSEKSDKEIELLCKEADEKELLKKGKAVTPAKESFDNLEEHQ